ncbi:putative capsid protein [Giant house spider associated circular virus 1]|uniref:Putative capsid protein n=1 Tax=Giant house spider associated circular virus 1 TaxID=2293288 RepID=A0A346BP83_9VIRU|nr:putative capsid protein [Giant house spider associated circular virus 1]AXL65880.1 putative capsid protein [Giant house spider associated circular virus 1]
MGKYTTSKSSGRYGTKRYARRSRTTIKRRYPARRKRAYTKRPRPMSRKRILNVSTTKKRDTLMSYDVARSQNGPAIVSSGSVERWTTNLLNYLPTSFSSADDDYRRTKNNVYFRGAKLAWNFDMSDSSPWEIRMIAFWGSDGTITANPQSRFYTTITPTGGSPYQVNGLLPVLPGSVPDLRMTLFQGTEGTDWFDAMIAPLDVRRNKIIIDKRMTLRSGNDVGSFKRMNLWVPANKMVRFNNDENGSDVDKTSGIPSGLYSPDCLYYVTLYKQRGAADTAAQLLVSCNATVYWHER